jgi:Carboxypeptidase regulatory-like domain
MRSLRIAIVILLSMLAVASIGAAQPPPRDQPRPPAQTGTASIRGRVFAADSGRPLRRARISVSAPELGSESRTVSTDVDGRYEVTDLPAGRYTLRVTRSGYLSLRYGQRRPLEQGKPLQVLDKQVVDKVDFSLPRMGLITGRVTDEFGDPIEGVSVSALRSMYFNGRRQFVPVGGPPLRTDDAGQYRVLGLAPGSYLVSGVTRETWTVVRDGVKQVMGYAPTYFPGATHVADARRVTVALGREASNTDFSLQPGRSATVSGTAFDSQGRPLSTVMVRQETRGVDFASFGYVASGSVVGGGTFRIDNVPPGEYILAASTGQGVEPAEVAEAPITIDGADLDNVTLTGSRGGSVSGQLLTEAGAVPNLARVRISMTERSTGQGSPMVLGASRNAGFAETTADGTFTIDGVFGTSRLRLTLPEDWAVKAVLYDGRDVTDAPIELRSGEAWSGVKVIVTDRVSTVTGQLTDAKDQPVTEGTVIVFAADANKWSEDSRYVRSVRADQQGQWRIKGLPPGDYLAVALDYVEEGMWNDPEYLSVIQRYAKNMTVTEADSQTIPLKVTREPR